MVSNFIVQALKGEPITIYGDGSQTRSFCYVDDLIEGFIRLMATPDEFTGPVNLGNPTSSRSCELAEQVIALDRIEIGDREAAAAGGRSGAAAAGHRDGERNLGWEPRVQLDEGLQKTIAYFAALLGGD